MPRRTWPLFDLTITTQRLSMRPFRESDLDDIAALLPDDFELDPALPTHAAPDPAQGRAIALYQYYWRHVGSFTANSWTLGFLVVCDGLVIGMQELEGRDRFPVRRVVESASWLTTGSRGQGYGKEMRAGVLRLAFEHLGALVAETEAWHDNAASLGVSAGLGYEPNGESIHVMGDRRDRMLAMRLTAEWWREREHLFPASIDGLESSRFLFGV